MSAATTTTPNQPGVAVDSGTTSDQHGLKAHSDGGWALVPVQTRSERFTSVVPGDFPAVTGLEADWKLTPVSLVRPLLDDALDGSPYSYTSTEGEGTLVEWA
jgi:Fe-S cluster assembly protein SufD